MSGNVNEPSSSSLVPSTTVTPGHTAPSWQSIRPWTPPLTLTVREVTSVSATFILSSAITSSSSVELEIDLEDNDLGNDEPHVESSVISNALEGLSVNVNGSPWQRVYIRIDDTSDEAVIIIYGLMPGRQYDIDLGIVRAPNLRRQITTQDADPEPPSPSPTSAAIASHSNNMVAAATTPANPSASTSQTPPDTSANSPAVAPFTIEDRLAQLNQTLSTLSTERESLQVKIKSVRRDSQKADAALRSEIEALKRASEKHVAAEARAKQKILALQEAVKRAQAGARTTEEQLQELERTLPSLLKEKKDKEVEYERVKRDAERLRKEREEADEKDRKRLDRMRAELSSLTHKLEKMKGKREKIELTVIPDLDEQLKNTKKEMERVQQEEEGLAVEELTNVAGFGVVGGEYQGFNRRRANTGGSNTSPGPGPISRPQRPLGTDAFYTPALWNSIPPSRLHESMSGSQLESDATDQRPTTLPTSLSSPIPQNPRRNSLRSSLPSVNPVTNGHAYPPGLGSYASSQPQTNVHHHHPFTQNLIHPLVYTDSQAYPQSQSTSQARTPSSPASTTASASSNSPIGTQSHAQSYLHPSGLGLGVTGMPKPTLSAMSSRAPPFDPMQSSVPIRTAGASGYVAPNLSTGLALGPGFSPGTGGPGPIQRPSTIGTGVSRSKSGTSTSGNIGTRLI